MNPDTLQCGLMLVHGNHPEALRDLLIAWMKRYPLAPLENEVILVHSNGIAQWLKLALAADAAADGGGCGIAAALELSLPASFLWRAYRAVLGGDAVPETSPCDKSRLLWRLVRLLPQLADQPVYAPLQRFLDQDGDARKRFQLAERLADVYDQYQVYRADWLAAWAAGDDRLFDAGGQARPLPDEQRWQAALWRALLADVGGGGAHGSDAVAAGGRAAVHAAFLDAAAAWDAAGRPPGLPRRVMVFGISALPRQALEVLAALARWTQVLMCVHNPCEYYWADIVSDRHLLAAGPARQTRRSGTPALVAEELLHLHAQPLLAAWGKQGRDFIGLLDEYDSAQARGDYRPQFAAIGQRIDLFAANAGASLLQQLQDDIRALRPLHETRAFWPPVDGARDASIRFHVAHSAQREVEILHDQLLDAFNADPTLRPRDVVVMVPDIDAYVPHIRAVFGLPGRQDARHIPFSLADQGRRHGDPLALAIETLIGLPTSRFAASDLLDLLDVPALRLRFGIDEQDLPLLHRWIRGANIRCGLHAEQRASLALPAPLDAPNSWWFGLRRMLLGYAVGAGADAWRAIEPYDEIGGLDAALLGPLVLLVERIDAYWRLLRQPATVDAWCDRLRALLADFFVAEQSRDAATLQQLDGALAHWREMCDEAAMSDALPLSVVGDYWLAQLDEGSLAQRFFAGAVTFATLMPMRAIPFRHVCLLGMNDGDYPRARVPMDFDLMGADYRPGDRSRREDDRYLFLEALLSARDALHISWVGRSVNDNTPRPPSVLVGQLRDHLAAGWALAPAAPAAPAAAGGLLAALTVEHRLQPFCADYFPGSAQATPLFTYAREWRRAAADERPAPGSAPLPPLARDEPLTLRELADFLKSPVKAFFTERLGVFFARDEAALDDQEPFELDGLARWQLQNELIAAQCAALDAGADDGPGDGPDDGPDDAPAIAAACAATLARIARRGELPAGAFGDLLGQALSEPMAELFVRYRAALARWPLAAADERPVRLAPAGGALGAGVELADWLGGLRRDASGQCGRVVLETSALVKDRHYRADKLIAHWLAHLAAQLAGEPVTTRVVSLVGEVELAPLAAGDAEALLEALIAAWQQGMCRPLPLAVNSALAWLKASPASASGDGTPPAAAVDAARSAYEGGFRQLGELGRCPYLQRAYPEFAALGAQTGYAEFSQLAESLLRPLLRALPVDPGRAEKAPARRGASA